MKKLGANLDLVGSSDENPIVLSKIQKPVFRAFLGVLFPEDM